MCLMVGVCFYLCWEIDWLIMFTCSVLFVWVVDWYLRVSFCLLRCLC